MKKQIEMYGVKGKIVSEIVIDCEYMAIHFDDDTFVLIRAYEDNFDYPSSEVLYYYELADLKIYSKKDLIAIQKKRDEKLVKETEENKKREELREKELYKELKEKYGTE